MTTSEELLPYPCDSLFDVLAVADEFGALSSTCDANSECVRLTFNPVSCEWEGEAATRASQRLHQFYDALNQAAANAQALNCAATDYYYALGTARSQIDDLRAAFRTHWPSDDSSLPYVTPDVCTMASHQAMLANWANEHSSALSRLGQSAQDFSQAVKDNAPPRAGLLSAPGSAAPLLFLPVAPWTNGPVTTLTTLIMQLPPNEFAHWLDDTTPEELARLYNGLPVDKRPAFASYVLQHADPLMFPKIFAGIPAVQPDPGLGAEWGTPGPNLPLYSDDPSHDPMNDVNQHGYGDCWMDAALAGLVHNDPDWVKNHVFKNPNGTVTVILYDDKGQPIPVTITNELPINSDGSIKGISGNYSDTNLNSSSAYSWAAYVEKAMAQQYHTGDGPNGTYAGIEGDWPENAAKYPTGKDGTATKSLDDVNTALAQGKTVIANNQGALSPSSSSDAYNKGILNIGLHSYTIIANSDGTYTLRNPWGNKHPEPLTAAELERFFGSYGIIN